MTRQREPRLLEPPYLAWIRRQPCVRCAWTGKFTVPSEAAHCKVAIAVHGWRGGGLSERSDDRRVTPLCVWCHRLGAEAQHVNGERTFWDTINICPACLCEALAAAFDAGASGVEVIYSAVRAAHAGPAIH